MNYSKILSMLVMSIIFSAGMISCRTKAGDPGPAGKDGTPFNYNAGFIKGTASGLTKETDASFNIVYNLTYFNDVHDNYIYTDGNFGKHMVIRRYDVTGESYITFKLGLDGQGNVNAESATVRLVSKDADKNYLFVGTGSASDTPTEEYSTNYYSSYQSTYLTVSNASFNASTGQIDFDYTLEISPDRNTTTNKLTLTGSLSADTFTESTRTGITE